MAVQMPDLSAGMSIVRGSGGRVPAPFLLGGWTSPVGLELAAMVVVSLLALTGAARRFARTA
jgi:hypothetical protein